MGDYGLGEDRPIAEFVVKLYEFTMSLPDPDRWLREAHDAVAASKLALPISKPASPVSPKRTVASLAGHLRAELELQIEHCEQLAGSLEGNAEIPSYYPERVREYLDQLHSWKSDLGEAGAETERTDMEACLARFERVRSNMAAFEFGRVAGPRPAKDADDDERALRKAAAKVVTDLRDRLFRKRLEVPFALFSVDELLGDLNKTAPYIRTIIQLVTAFRDAYASRKRDLGVLDFADLERYAFDLLTEGRKPDTPSQAALSLHERFRHVLVDEFQDINPIQDAIIRLASRESDPSRPSNLFVVGDVKQSIYRFRLAEPGLFIERLNDGADPATSSVAIRLQTNFRSRPPVIDAVNTVFERLMRKDFGGVAYDDDARLRAGRSVEPADTDKVGLPADPRVELHVLEKKWSDSSDDDDDVDPIDRGPAALTNKVGSPTGKACLQVDPARWSPIEREAYLIGLCIRDSMANDALETDGRPLGYGDVAVLLRARKVNAERVASILALMGIPAYADASGSLLATREIRDVLAALQLFDNAQQDIPLAAVMRSGILCEPLSVDELLDIRCHDRDVAFHEAVRAYAKQGRDRKLRGRVRGLLNRLASYRESARRRPLAGVLWELYEKQGYLAYASGLPGGVQRRANLLELHDLARRFGTFRRQGLRRFLGFVHLLDEGRQELPSAPSVGEADDVVRIMSIHQAKGLEFPVVFVAGLGTKFNLSDRSGRMIFERDAGIGLRAVDTDRMIEYPTVVHSRVAASIDRSTREEEMRVLYVAMTRARDKLVLVGSRNHAEEIRAAGGRTGKPVSPVLPVADGGSGPSRLTVTTAVTPLDWLTPIVSESSLAGLAAPLNLHVHSVEEMSGWQQPQHDEGMDDDTRRAVAKLAELPAEEPLATDDACVETVRARVDYAYPFLSSSSVRAVVAASEFKGTHDFLSDPEARRESSPADDFSVGSSRYATT
ncbi:MAG: UvrD-helicase domain-containing protein, partial [Myxococcota bacterium]